MQAKRRCCKSCCERLCRPKSALVENDFGAVSLDAKLLKSGGYTVQELRAGCICCTLNGNFVSALVSLLRRAQPDVVLIEPSGVAKLSDVEAFAATTGWRRWRC